MLLGSCNRIWQKQRRLLSQHIKMNEQRTTGASHQLFALAKWVYLPSDVKQKVTGGTHLSTCSCFEIYGIIGARLLQFSPLQWAINPTHTVCGRLMDATHCGICIHRIHQKERIQVCRAGDERHRCEFSFSEIFVVPNISCRVAACLILKNC